MNNQIPGKVKTYLSKRASDKWDLKWNKKNEILNTIVVPSLAEFDSLKLLLKSLAENDKEYFHNTLVIFIVNNKKTEKDDYKFNNKETINFLQKIIGENLYQDDIIDQIKLSGLQIGYIDASSPGYEMDEKNGGVGLARKIGMDEALKIFNYSNSSKKILICLDADCTVEKNYISSVVRVFNSFNILAATINFHHLNNSLNENENAIIAYELFLRYYVLGLRYANSPYSFHTIGSSMACDVDAYIKVEGMNKRNAAEDFYFLQKLSKNFPIYNISDTCVYPSSRKSDRVPFGTGRTMDEAYKTKLVNYSAYNIESFTVLKLWLELFNSPLSLNINAVMDESKKIAQELYNFLQLNSFPDQWQKILDSCNNEIQLEYQRKNWFGGFKTLKLMHHLRDNGYHQQNIFESVNALLLHFDELPIKLYLDNHIPELPIQKEFIKKMIELEQSNLDYAFEIDK